MISTLGKEGSHKVDNILGNLCTSWIEGRWQMHVTCWGDDEHAGCVASLQPSLSPIEHCTQAPTCRFVWRRLAGTRFFTNFLQ